MKSLLRGLEIVGQGAARFVRFVCSDMWKAYLKVIRRKLPDALHIPDRYHIVANLNKTFDEASAAEAKRLQAEGCTILKPRAGCSCRLGEERADVRRLIGVPAG